MAGSPVGDSVPRQDHWHPIMKLAHHVVGFVRADGAIVERLDWRLRRKPKARHALEARGLRRQT
jgi:hypothetical protein